jgi:hypothetical protein
MKIAVLLLRHFLICAESFLIDVRLALLRWLLGLLCVVSLVSCARQEPYGPSDPSLTGAAAISDRIQDKAVIVQQWLATHPR